MKSLLLNSLFYFLLSFLASALPILLQIYHNYTGHNTDGAYDPQRIWTKIEEENVGHVTPDQLIEIDHTRNHHVVYLYPPELQRKRKEHQQI